MHLFFLPSFYILSFPFYFFCICHPILEEGRKGRGGGNAPSCVGKKMKESSSFLPKFSFSNKGSGMLFVYLSSFFFAIYVISTVVLFSLHIAHNMNRGALSFFDQSIHSWRTVYIFVFAFTARRECLWVTRLPWALPKGNYYLFLEKFWTPPKVSTPNSSLYFYLRQSSRGKQGLT